MPEQGTTQPLQDMLYCPQNPCIRQLAGTKYNRRYMMQVKEGYLSFREGKTYYRIVGECQGNKKPLLLLHGGPGSTHNYFEVMDDLAQTDGRMVVMYDQIGCGKSYIEGHPEYFNAETWIEELAQLRKALGLREVHILGQSWGGMMALWYALDYHPQGVKSYILSSTLPSAKLWESEQHRRISYMEQKHQDAFSKALSTGCYDDPAYLEALDLFMNRHCNPIMKELPECMTRKKQSGKESYLVGWGPNEFTPTGTLSGFEMTSRLHEIQTPCLITSGQRDLCSPYIAKTMYDRLPHARWELFAYSGHMPFVEEHDKYVSVLTQWLNENDQ